MTRDRVGLEQPAVLDALDAAHGLQDRIDVALQHVPAELPALAVPAARDRAERGVQVLAGAPLDVLGVELAPRHQLGRDREPTVVRRCDEDAGADHAPTVEVVLDPVDHVHRRHKLLEPELAVGAFDLWNDEDAGLARVVLVGRRNTLDTRELGRRLAGELLEVLRRDRAVSGPERDRPTQLGVLDVFAVDPAGGRAAILDGRDVRDRGAQHRERSVRDVPAPAAAGRILAQPKLRSLWRDGPVAAIPCGGRTVLLRHRSPEHDLACGVVQNEALLVCISVGEARHLVPLLDPTVDDHLEHVLLVPGQPKQRAPFETEALA